METRDWILLRCTSCSTLLKLRRGLPAVYVGCPDCGETLTVPDGILDPERRLSVFDGDVYQGSLTMGEGRQEQDSDQPVSPPMADGNGAAERAGSIPSETAGSAGKRDLLQAAQPPAPKRAEDLDLNVPSLPDSLEEWEKGGEQHRSVGDSTSQGRDPDDGNQKRYRRSLKKRKAGGGDQLMWEASEGGGARRPDRLAKRFTRIAVLLLLGLGAALVALVFTKEEKGGVVKGTDPLEGSKVPAAAVAVAPGLSDGEVETGTIDLETYEAIKVAVEGFASASNVDEMIGFVRDPERVREIAPTFYRTRPYVPFGLREVASRDQMVRDGNFVSFRVEGDGYERREIGVEFTPEGPKVDWESFVGYSEVDWTDLLIRLPTEPVLLRAVVSRDNYFNYGFGNPSGLDCYRLTDLKEGVRIYGYVEKGTPTADTIQLALASAPKMLLTLSVRYPDPAPANNQVQIEKFIEKGWVLRSQVSKKNPDKKN